MQQTTYTSKNTTSEVYCTGIKHPQQPEVKRSQRQKRRAYQQRPTRRKLQTSSTV